MGWGQLKTQNQVFVTILTCESAALMIGTEQGQHSLLEYKHFISKTNWGGTKKFMLEAKNHFRISFEPGFGA